MPKQKTTDHTVELAAARARLERAERSHHAVQHSQPAGAAGFDGWQSADSRARAEVADARAALRRAEHACKIDDADANALRALLRSEVIAARDAFEHAPPAPPTLTAFSPDAVAAHVTAVTACLAARAEHEARIEKARMRLRVVLASVYDARQRLVEHRQATGGVLPPPIVRAAQPGTRGPLPFEVPGSAEECDALIEVLDAALPEPDLGRLAYEADALREQADEIDARTSADAAE